METVCRGRVRWQGWNSIFGRCLLPSRVIYTQSMSIAEGVWGEGGLTEVSIYRGGKRGHIASGGTIRIFDLGCFLSLFFYIIQK